MYKVLTIGGKDYRLEYTIEAALYKDGVDRLVDFLGGTFGAEGADAIAEKLSDEEAKKTVRVEIVKNLKSEVTNLPNTALILFYSGLLEYHGEEGDQSVMSISDAKHLAKQLFAEQPDDGIKDFADLLATCIDQMAADGFFKTTGLETLMQNAAKSSGVAVPNRAARRAKAKASVNK